MADQKDEQSGKKGGTATLEEITSKAKQLQEKVLEEAKALKEPQKTQVYKSVFRVKHDESVRSRALGILTNV